MRLPSLKRKTSPATNITLYLQHSTYSGATASWQILTVPSPETSSHGQHFYYVLSNLTENSTFTLVIRWSNMFPFPSY